MDEPLRSLLARGMAKDPAARPASAAQLLAELEATASAAYGDGWESTGRGQLAARASELILASGSAGAAAGLAGTGAGAGAGTMTTATTLRAITSHPILSMAIAVSVAVLAGGGAAVLATAAAHPAVHPVADGRAPTPSASPAIRVTASATPATPVPSRSSPASVASSARPVAPCPTPGLTLALDMADQQTAAGRHYIPLEFTNKSGQACTLYGYPGVALTTGAGGTAEGAPATRVASAPKEVITLAPGATASATLEVMDVLFYDSSYCNPVPVSDLQVYPPGQTSAAYVPYQAEGSCSNPVFVLATSPVVAGVRLLPMTAVTGGSLTQFAGTWGGHGRTLTIQPGGQFTIGVATGITAAGENAHIYGTLTSVSGNVASGAVTRGSAAAGIPAGPITMTLSNGVITVSPSSMNFCTPAIQASSGTCGA